MNRNMYTEGEYLENNPTWHTEDSAWKARELFKIIQRNGLEPTSMCEVGCGAGEILNQLRLLMPHDVSFTGYEISPQAFALCQERTGDRLRFRKKNLLEDEDAFFDIVMAIDVFEHVEDYIGFLRHMRLRGSYKIFHIPLDISVQAVLRSSKILELRQRVGHLHYFTKETALQALQDTGYDILDYFYTASSVGLPPKTVKSLLARLPRKLMYKLNKDVTVRVLGGYSLMVLSK